MHDVPELTRFHALADSSSLQAWAHALFHLFKVLSGDWLSTQPEPGLQQRTIDTLGEHIKWLKA
jgi:hypothetical protein